MTTIAIIEDDTYIGGLLEETLTQEGYSVIRAYSGTEALLLLEKRRPDLILLDLMLPGLTGEELEIDNQALHLTRTETAILKLLMQNPGHVIAKSVLLDRISLEVSDCTESSLKVHVSNLRKKLKTVSDKEYIESVWGIGFRLYLS